MIRIDLGKDENATPSLQNSGALNADSSAFVKNSIQKELSLNVDVEHLPKTTITALEKLLQEREHWRMQAMHFSQETSRLNTQVEALKVEKETHSMALELLRKDEQSLNNRISALMMEQREVKTHWLAEKSDLQTRLFHVQALNTQMQGTLKKKEKDYEKLQLQLSKMVNSSSRVSAVPSSSTSKGNAASAPSQRATIQISQPLKKALSQDASQSSTNTSHLLKDAEVSSLRSSLSALTVENSGLRSTVEQLQAALSELQVSCEKAVQMAQLKYKEQLAEMRSKMILKAQQKNSEEVANPTKDVTESLKPISFVQGPATPSNTTESGFNADVDVVSPTDSEFAENMNSRLIMASIPKTPLVTSKESASIGDLLMSPGTRPVQWIVEQTRTEVKKLREKVEDIAAGKSNFDSKSADLDCPEDSGSSISEQFAKLKNRLFDALMVIQEQDKLIHDALLGRLPGMTTSSDVDTIMFSPVKVVETEEDLKGSSLSEDTLEDLLKDENLLPPASPDTIQLLQRYGWALPKGVSMAPPGSGRKGTKPTPRKLSKPHCNTSSSTATMLATATIIPAEQLEF